MYKTKTLSVIKYVFSTMLTQKFLQHLLGYMWLAGKTSAIVNAAAAAAAAKLLQSCPTLCDTIDGGPSGSSVPGILQARTMEWVVISFSNAWKWKVKGKSLSRVQLLATPWIAAYQAPPSMGISRQEYWSGLPVPSLHKCCIKLISEPRHMFSQETITPKKAHTIESMDTFLALICLKNCGGGV